MPIQKHNPYKIVQMFEEEVQAKMSSIDFDTVTSLCLEKLMESDPKQYGVIRPAEFKRYLSSVAYAAELTEAEISQVTYKLPNDSFGRILYNGLGDALKKTKFVSLKTQLVEAQGTELQRMLSLLMSLWIMCLSCKYVTPNSICVQMYLASTSVTGQSFYDPVSRSFSILSLCSSLYFSMLFSLSIDLILVLSSSI